MKYFKKTLLFLTLSFGIIGNLTIAEEGSWGEYGTDPVDIVDNVKDSAGTTPTQLDQSGGEGSGIQGTLEFIRDNVGPYIDWGVFIGLSLGVLLIVYNALLLVVGPVKDGNVNNVKTRIIYIAVGIIVLTGFYFIIKMIGTLVKGVVG